MQRRILFILFALQLCGAFISPCYAEVNARAPEPQQAEELVRSFYQWYTNVYSTDKKHPAEHDVIYEYVGPCTVQRCRKDLKKNAMDADYFLRTNGFEPEDAARLVVHKSIKLNEHLAIVPVGEDKPYILVFVQEEQGKLRIIKEEDIFCFKAQGVQ